MIYFHIYLHAGEAWREKNLLEGEMMVIIPANLWKWAPANQ
jgi:hypothetical protein